eukprot:Skav226547  [mRNA]  locus=scaffold421:161742:187273:- [translate_table: standard]
MGNGTYPLAFSVLTILLKITSQQTVDLCSGNIRAAGCAPEEEVIECNSEGKYCYIYDALLPFCPQHEAFFDSPFGINRAEGPPTCTTTTTGTFTVTLTTTGTVTIFTTTRGQAIECRDFCYENTHPWIVKCGWSACASCGECAAILLPTTSDVTSSGPDGMFTMRPTRRNTTLPPTTTQASTGQSGGSSSGGGGAPVYNPDGSLEEAAKSDQTTLQESTTSAQLQSKACLLLCADAQKYIPWDQLCSWATCVLCPECSGTSVTATSTTMPPIVTFTFSSTLASVTSQMTTSSTTKSSTITRSTTFTGFRAYRFGGHAACSLAQLCTLQDVARLLGEINETVIFGYGIFLADNCSRMVNFDMPRSLETRLQEILRVSTRDTKTVTKRTEETKGIQYTKYVPSQYSDYIPKMDNAGIEYEKYMQGQPDAMKFQQKVLPEGNYQHYIPLSQNGKVDKSDEPELLFAAASKEKKDSADKKSRAEDKAAAADHANDQMDFERYMHAPSPGPVVSKKYGQYIPGKYSDYVPEMDDSGIKYQKYMQGQPDAMKVQQKVLPEGNYQHYIPLSQNGKVDKSDEPELLFAAASKEKKDSADKKSRAEDKAAAADHANDQMDFERYMHAPSPGPVVSKKYGQYIPGKYSDYVPEMDDSGIKYQKYMQGQPDAMKVQQKVLPEGNYQHYIPLSQNGKVDKSDEPELLFAAASKEKKDSADKKSRAEDKAAAADHANDQMDFERYMHAPSPGPVVSKKYGQYIPGKYSDYVPEMDDSGIKYQKYMQGQPDAMKVQQKVLPEGNYQHYIPLSQNGKVDKSDEPELLFAAASKEKKDSADKKSRAEDKAAAADHANDQMDFERYMHAPSPGPVVSKKYGQYIPGKYSDYVPEMDDSGIKYQKYMQGQPDAMKVQQKVLPEGNYQHYIPLSQNGKVDKSDEPELLFAAASKEKKDSADKKSRAEDKAAAADHANDQMDFERYMHAPSPGPVVSKKYGQYIPGKYSDYVPEMDDSGIKYQKYMQGQPDAMKVQQKVLPEGNYQHYIPLSQNGKVDKSDEPELLFAAASKEKKDSADKKSRAEDKAAAADHANDQMDFERYMHAPSPGPVVSKKYGQYIPGKYSDYVPEMDDSGIKYQKYMPDRSDSRARTSQAHEDCVLSIQAVK